MLEKIPFLGKRLDANMQEVVKKGFIALVMRLLGAGLAFGFNVLLARMLGAEGSGVYILALTVSTFAAVFGKLGMDLSLLRFVAANAAIDDWAAVKGVYHKSMQLALSASTITAFLLFLITPWLAEYVFNKPELIEPMRWMALAVVPTVFFMLQAQVLKGLKKTGQSSLIEIVGVSALSMLGLALIGPKWGVTGAVWVYVISTIIIGLLGFVLCWLATPQTRGLVGRFDRKELLESSIPLLWVTSTYLLMTWAATLLLGIWGTKADVGIFNVASRTANLTQFILIGINSIVEPKFAGLYRRGEMAALNSMARKSAKLTTVLALPLVVIFAGFPNLIMGIFGPQFKEGSLILVILTAGQFVNVATGSVAQLLVMSGNEKIVRNTIGAAAFGNVLLNIILIPLYGSMGAAIATSLTIAILNLTLAYLVWNRLQIWMIPFVKNIFKRRPQTPES
jgi:O-antigen/teichoic acid export membrane protein